MNPQINDNHRADEVAQRMGRVAIQLCTIDEPCELLRVSRSQVNDLLNKRLLASVKIGRRRLVPLADLRAFIEQRQIGALR